MMEKKALVAIAFACATTAGSAQVILKCADLPVLKQASSPIYIQLSLNEAEGACKGKSANGDAFVVSMKTEEVNAAIFQIDKRINDGYIRKEYTDEQAAMWQRSRRDFESNLRTISAANFKEKDAATRAANLEKQRKQAEAEKQQSAQAQREYDALPQAQKDAIAERRRATLCAQLQDSIRMAAAKEDATAVSAINMNGRMYGCWK